MGMAHFMGQLSLSAARDCGPLDSPCLLLLRAFSTILCAARSTALSLQEEARLHLERAAFSHSAPARYKPGHAYKFALPTFLFDALLGVQYYTLTSRQGEVEAQNLAFTFAEKAARKGLGSAEFAMGY